MRSTKVPYFILDLLQQVPSVYVQGLGRFDAIFHPAVIDVSQGRIMPPRMEATFAADGTDEKQILEIYMQYVSGIDREEARALIRDFVSDVRTQLEENGSCAIEKFGTFSRSAADIIHFTPDWDAFNLSFTGLEALDLHPGTKPVETSPPRVFQEVQEQEPAPLNYIYDIPADTNWVTDSEVTQPVSETTETLTTPVYTPSESTSRLWWVLATALFLITVLCAFLAWDIFSNRDRVNQIIAISNDTLANSSPDIIIVDTLEFFEEELPPDTPVVEEPVVEAPAPEVIEKPCYIVVGAFTQQANIDNMEARLKGLGYATEQIKGGSLTRVAVESSCERGELQARLNELRSTVNPEAWIY